MNRLQNFDALGIRQDNSRLRLQLNIHAVNSLLLSASNCCKIVTQLKILAVGWYEL